MEDIALLGLGIDSGPITRGTASLREFENQAGRTEGAAKGLEQTTALLTKAMGLLGIALSATELVRMTAVWTDLNSRIRNAVSAHESAVSVMDRIDEMARRTYSSLEQTADSYLRNATALTQLGYSTAEQLDLTEALNNALVVSAIKGEAAESIMTAWSKAMALGALNGDNLNTIIMSSDRLAKALADSMGISVLELRKFGEEGKITGDKMFGVTTQLEALRAEAEAMPATIVDAGTLLGNALLSTVGRIDEALGASTAIAEAMIAFGDNIEMLVPVIGGLAAVLVTALVPGLVSATLAVVAFAASPLGLLTIGIGALAAVLTNEWNQHRLAAAAAREHASALTLNESAMVTAKTASKEFREALRDQITDQLAAADAALAEAEAQKTAAQSKLAAANLLASGMGAIGTLFGIVSPDQVLTRQQENEAAIMGAWQATVDEASSRVADFRAQLAELNEIMTTPPGEDDDANRPDDPTKSQVKALKAYDDLIAATERRVSALQSEAEALGLTAVEAQNLTNLHELMAEAEATGVEMTDARIEQLITLSERLTDAQLTLEGLHMALENRTPWETMAEEIERLNELLERGKIGTDDYVAGMGVAIEEMVSKYASGANDVIDNVEKLTDALGLQGKEAFEVQKALGIARAVVSGAESITHSFNAGTAIGGPPLGFAFAGIAAAATAAQIGALMSTSYQSKSVPGAAGGGGSATAAAPVQAPAQEDSRALHIYLQGGSAARYTSDDIAEIVAGYNDLVKDGGPRINVQTV